MSEYESVIILQSDLSKEKLQETTLKIENKINEYAKITKKDDIGKRKLAYEIRKNKEGHYFLYEFQMEDKIKAESIHEIERLYRITDEIIKYITIKK